MIKAKWPAKYVGMPFKPKGRQSDGVDCWGLYRLIMKNEKGIDVPRFDEYGSTDIKDAENIARLVENYCLTEWVQIIGKPKEFDVLVLKVAGLPWHIGITIDKMHFIHAIKKQNTIIERYDSANWKNKITGIYRHVSMC